MKLPIRYRILQMLVNFKDWLVAGLISFMIWLVRLVPRELATRWFGSFARWFGPKIWRHKIVVKNLEIAFPEMTGEERKQLASDSWAEMAKSLVEYVHLDDIFDMDGETAESKNIEVRNAGQFLKLRDDGQPAILFTGHIANFELLPMVAARFGLVVHSLFRQPNNKYAADHVARARSSVSQNLIASGRGAAFQLVHALERGDHVGLLVDQKFRKGIKVKFFGKDAPTNTLLAKLARRYDCPVHGARCIRLPDGRFRLEITDELQLPRDEKGEIDVVGTTQMVTDMIEDWVREYPEQWLWMHRRWG